MKNKFLTLAVAMTLLVSCGKKEAKKQEEAKPKTEVATKKEEAKEAKLEIAGTDQMTFDKKEMHVKAGQKVTLTLKHSGKMGKNVMGHNWVLLKNGTDMAKFAEKAMPAKDNGYIPEDKSDIIAYTKVVGGGESVTITFTAPEKGTYDYICSFPGHYSMMNGKLIVE